MSAGPDVRRLVPLDEARAILAVVATPISRIERVALADLAGRVLAEDVVARIDVPPMDRAAMDGFAVIASDTQSASADHPVQLRVADSSWAGHPAARPVTGGECVAIATGAEMPAGSDAVVMVEHTSRRGDEVSVRMPARPGQHIGRRGGDLARGTTALRAGSQLTPARVGVVAALGGQQITVYGRPRVAILSTGDEVVPPGEALGPGQIYDVNSTTLAAVVRGNGGEPIVHRAVGDEPEALRAAFERCLDQDLVIVSGGSSVGERDLVLDLLATKGEILFPGIRLKPGKPTVLARVEGRPVFGMPGNPTSCLSNAYLLLAPLLRQMARWPPLRPRTIAARLASRVSSPADRHQFYTVRVAGGEAIPAFKGSGEITSLAEADGYFEIPEGIAHVEAGETVEVTLFEGCV
jgi:molybdopterin molybdotransferase